MKNYTTYAFAGGNLVKLFDDDIVMDTDAPAVSVPVPDRDEAIEFVSRGPNNRLPVELIKKIGKNVTLGANVDFRTKVIYGDGIAVYRKVRDKNNKIQKVEVLESECPEVFEFLEQNEYDTIRMEIANDLYLFGEAYVEYKFNRQDTPTVARLAHRETSCSLISKIDSKAGYSQWHGYSAKWDKGTPDDLIVTPLLHTRYPMLDLMERMGRITNSNGKKEIVRDREFVHRISINTPGRFYYSRPYWWSVIKSGWADFSSAIPLYKKALLVNQLTVRTLVYIKDSFWEKLFQGEKATDDKAKKEVKERFLKNLEDYLAGEANAGKTMVSEFRYDRIKGYEDKDIIIETIDMRLKGGEYIEDSEEASNTLSYGMGVHPSIIGASPGKNKSINGTEARELFLITQTLSKIYQDLTLKPLYIVKKMNNWPSDIYFEVVNCQLTTLDQNSGAKKNIGIESPTE